MIKQIHEAELVACAEIIRSSFMTVAEKNTQLKNGMKAMALNRSIQKNMISLRSPRIYEKRTAIKKVE